MVSGVSEGRYTKEIARSATITKPYHWPMYHKSCAVLVGQLIIVCKIFLI